MKIEIACQCGKRFAAQEHLAGQNVPCPFCGAMMRIPAVQPARPVAGQVRCEYCHKYLPRSQYTRHVQQHLQLRDDGQQSEYATLPPEERTASPNFSQHPRWYRHERCGAVTGMPEEIIQTYLTNPWFYLSDKTFCTGCGRHVRLRECTWEETGENLHVYNERLRAAKPELRPGAAKLFLAWIYNTFFG